MDGHTDQKMGLGVVGGCVCVGGGGRCGGGGGGARVLKLIISQKY